MIVLHNGVFCFMADTPVSPEFLRGAADQLDVLNAALVRGLAATPAPEPPVPDYSAAATRKERERVLAERAQQQADGVRNMVEDVVVRAVQVIVDKGFYCRSMYSLNGYDVPAIKDRLESLGYVVSEADGMFNVTI